jgi:hypothetical protein
MCPQNLLIYHPGTLKPTFHSQDEMRYNLFAHLNKTHQLLVCADDISLLDEEVNTVKTSTEELFTRSDEVNWNIQYNLRHVKYTESSSKCLGAKTTWRT